MRDKSVVVRYIVATIGALLVFACTLVLAGFLVAMTLPESWLDASITVGSSSQNIGGLVVYTLALLAATHSFRASLRAKKKRPTQAVKS